MVKISKTFKEGYNAEFMVKNKENFSEFINSFQ